MQLDRNLVLKHVEQGLQVDPFLQNLEPILLLNEKKSVYDRE